MLFWHLGFCDGFETEKCWSVGLQVSVSGFGAHIQASYQFLILLEPRITPELTRTDLHFDLDARRDVGLPEGRRRSQTEAVTFCLQSNLLGAFPRPRIICVLEVLPL